MPNKFTAIKFPLKMRGVDVRNLEDLRENFDLNAAVAYFKDGKLLKWLEARYYDDEAENISSLDENAPDFREKLCAALGVEFEGDDSRVEEKKNRLRELTDDESIIDNAAVTALNQEDLADLLDAGTSTIYLCGTRFSIPIRVTDKKYIGVLDPPLIKIRANSQADIDAQNISFVNVHLPWEKSFTAEKSYRPTAQTQSTTSDELRDMAEVIFGNRNVWHIIGMDDEPSSAQRKMFIKLICGGEYSERDLIYLQADKDFAAGWALTRDAFCVGGAIKFQCLDMQADDAAFQAEIDEKLAQARRHGRKKILYKDIVAAQTQGNFAPEPQSDINGLLGGYLSLNNRFGYEDNSFMTTSSIGGFMIVDRDEIYWQVTRDDFTTEDSVLMVVKTAHQNLFKRTLNKFDVLNDKIEAQIIKFLNFAKG